MYQDTDAYVELANRIVYCANNIESNPSTALKETDIEKMRILFQKRNMSQIYTDALFAQQKTIMKELSSKLKDAYKEPLRDLTNTLDLIHFSNQLDEFCDDTAEFFFDQPDLSIYIFIGLKKTWSYSKKWRCSYLLMLMILDTKI